MKRKVKLPQVVGHGGEANDEPDKVMDRIETVIFVEPTAKAESEVIESTTENSPETVNTADVVPPDAEVAEESAAEKVKEAAAEPELVIVFGSFKINRNLAGRTPGHGVGSVIEQVIQELLNLN